MPYPASTKTLAQWVADVDRQASALKSNAQSQSDQSTAGTLAIERVRQFFDFLVDTAVLFNAAAAVPGIGSYLTTQKQGASPDPVADFNAMRTQVLATLDWLRANVPAAAFTGADGNLSYKLGFSMPADNVSYAIPLRFTAAQTAGYRTALAALIATVS